MRETKTVSMTFRFTPVTARRLKNRARLKKKSVADIVEEAIAGILAPHRDILKELHSISHSTEPNPETIALGRFAFALKEEEMDERIKHILEYD